VGGDKQGAHQIEKVHVAFIFRPKPHDSHFSVQTLNSQVIEINGDKIEHNEVVVC
jgi:hypothetical protein